MIERRTYRVGKFRIGVFGVLTALAGTALAAGAPQVVGIASAVLNDVSIESAGARQFRHAVLRQQVGLSDQVQTGLHSQLQVLLLDTSVFTIGANARLMIDRYVYDPAVGRSFSTSIAKGAFRFISGRPDRRGSSSINTPVAAIGVRGTIVDGVVGAEAIAIANGERGIGQNRDSDPLTATLVILRGPGQLTQGKVVPGEITVTADGKTVTLDRPMLAVYVPRSGAAPIGPFTISTSGLARVQALIFPSLAEWLAATKRVSNTPYPVAPTRQVRRPAPRGDFPPDGSAGGWAQPPTYDAGIPSLPQFSGGMASPAGQSTPPRQQTGSAAVQQPAAVPVTSQAAITPSTQPQPAPGQPQSAAGTQSLAPAPQALPASGNSPPQPPVQQSPGVAPIGQISGAGQSAAAQLQSPTPALQQPTPGKQSSSTGVPGKP